MRPVFRDASPQVDDFDDYRDAFGELVSRLGLYCSYCERRIPTNLAVEHIQPKGLPIYEHLEGSWDNFLLGCVNCNSTKGSKDVVLSDIFLPDRDNTAFAFEYPSDGTIAIRSGLTVAQTQIAEATLKLTGLDKSISEVIDSNGDLVAIDRVGQRMEVRLIAEMSRDDLDSNPTEVFRRQIARTATGFGFFSIWMNVFEADLVVREFLVEEFKGTASNCFDLASTSLISPRPPVGLAGESKI